METSVPLATTSTPPTPEAEFSRKAASFAIEQPTPDPSKRIASPPVPCHLPTAFLTKNGFEMLVLVLQADWPTGKGTRIKNVLAVSVVSIQCARARMTALFRAITSQHWTRVPMHRPARNDFLLKNKRQKEEQDHPRRLVTVSSQYDVENETIQLKKAIKMPVRTLLLRTMLYYSLPAMAELSRAEDAIVFTNSHLQRFDKWLKSWNSPKTTRPWPSNAQKCEGYILFHSRELHCNPHYSTSRQPLKDEFNSRLAWVCWADKYASRINFEAC